MQRKVMSMCVSTEYCRGYNDAVEAYNKGVKISMLAIGLKYSRDYYRGWNDAVLASKQA